MPSQSWNVDFDGPSRRITAEVDLQSGRVAIRVDGRMAARPMAPEEDERAFTIGSVTYVIRRKGDELDLDIAPAHMQAPPSPNRATTTHASRTPAAKKREVPVFRIIAGIVLTIAIGAAVRWGARYVTYMNVPWQSYTHPDRMFRVKFAGVPQKSSETVGALRTLQLKSFYKGHFYVVEYIQFPDWIPAEETKKVTDAIYAAVVEGEKWITVKSDWTHRGLDFIAEVPKSKDWSVGTARGSLIPHRDRIYIVYAFVPRGESLGWDVGEFLRSLELAE